MPAPPEDPFKEDSPFPKPTNKATPSGSTVGSIVGGGVGTMFIIILTQVAHLQIDAVAGSSIGAACAAICGYFFMGGKAVDTE